MGRFEIELGDRIAEVYREGRWIAVMVVAEAAGRFLDQVASAAGIEAPATVDQRSGSPLIGLAVHGSDPDPGEAFQIVSLHAPSAGSFVDDILNMAAKLESIPGPTLVELDQWDPERRARVLAPSVLTDRPIAGRETYGSRPPAWAALEDKIAVLDLWKDAGIPTAPSEVHALTDQSVLMAAHHRLAGVNGSVWAVDNANGMHGGAAGTHWVPSSDAVTELADRLGRDHRSVRIMPFLDGVPCSIHGIVLDGKTVATRPNEMLVFVDAEARRFVYAQFANHWDPSSSDRAAMVGMAEAVGDALRAAVDFRGVFSLDGVLTVEGFRPTEINPRYSMGLPFTLPTADGRTIDLVLLDKAIIAGDIDPDPESFGTWLVAALDENRRGVTSFAATRTPAENHTATIVGSLDDDNLTLVSDASSPDDDATPIAAATWNAGGAGPRLQLRFADGFPVGPPAAPTAWRLAQFVDRHWHVGLANLTPALSL